MPKFVDHVGSRFGKLLVLKRSDRRPGVFWICQCDCGNITETARYNLSSGDTKSCGCFKAEDMSRRFRKIGSATRKDYLRLKAIIARCCDEEHVSYKNYGGRGISVCERWMESLSNFVEDMGPCPEGHTIERIDNDGNYEPGNCRWATMKEQAQNRRTNVFVDLDDGNGPLTFTEQCNRFGIIPNVAKNRIKNGMDVKEAIMKPVKKNKNSKN